MGDSNWHNKIDKDLENAKARRDRENARIDQEKQFQLKLKLQWLNLTCKCVECGTGATSFYSENMAPYSYSSEYNGGDVEKVDTNRPGNLSKCENCHKWVCNEDKCSYRLGDYTFIKTLFGTKKYPPGRYCKRCASRIFK